MDELYGIPSVLLLAIAVASTIVIVWLVQRAIPEHVRCKLIAQRHSEISAHILGIAGVIYGVVLAFLMIVVWQKYHDAEDRLAIEAGAVADAWHTSLGLPHDVQEKVQCGIDKYVNLMQSQEWTWMKTGNPDDGKNPRDGTRLMMALTVAAAKLDDVRLNESAKNAQLLTVQQLIAAHDGRLRRIASNETGLGLRDWIILLVGAAIVVGLSTLFGMRMSGARYAMTLGVGILIATLLVDVFELQYPYRGTSGISSKTWSELARHIKDMELQSSPTMQIMPPDEPFRDCVSQNIFKVISSMTQTNTNSTMARFQASRSL